MSEGDERVKVTLCRSDLEIVERIASERHCPKARVVAEAASVGLGVLGSAGHEGASRELSQAAESAAGALALLSWVLPQLCKGDGDGDNAFLSYFGGLSPTKVWEVGRFLGSSLCHGDKGFPGALRDLPGEVGLDTREFAGVDRKRWERLCEESEEYGHGQG